MPWIVAGVVLLLGGLALLPSAVFPLEMLSNLRPQLAALCLLLAVASVSTGRLGVGLAMAAMTAALLSAAPQLFERPGRIADGPRLNVVWSNVFKDPRAVRRVAEWAAASDADLVVIGEPPRDKRALADVLKQWPHRFGDERDRHGVLIFSRLPLTNAELSADHRRNGYPTTSVTVEAPSGPIRVVGLHPAVPASPERLRSRDAQILAAAQAAEAAGRALIVGDLNATPWTSAFRALARRTDVRRLSTGAASTWFARWPVLGLPIDHALVTREVEGAARVGPGVGSDHLPLLVQVR